MEALLEYFESMTSWQKLAWIVICLSFNLIGEAVQPLFNFDYKKLRHVGTNLVFLVVDLSINVLFGLATIGIMMWLSANEIGLLYLVDLPLIIELLIGIMLLDFMAQYFVHYLLHNIPWMWRLHMVHHSDTHVDATTATRHHPGDYLLREVFSLIAIIIGGIPLAYYLFYRIITVFFAYFTHANISLPSFLDRTLSFIIVTPNMHKFHHHFERPWTDTNFGNIFSFWDRMFGTLVYDNPKEIVYGLDVTDDSRDLDLAYQYGLPFNKSIKVESKGWKFWEKAK